MTHQEIADRLAQIDAEQTEAHRASREQIRARFDKERQSLEELHGGLGHIMRPVEMRLGSWLPAGSKQCAVCGFSQGTKVTIGESTVVFSRSNGEGPWSKEP